MKSAPVKDQSFIYVIKSDNGVIDLIEDYNYKGDYLKFFEIVIRIKMPVKDFYPGTHAGWDISRKETALSILRIKKPDVYKQFMAQHQ